MDSYNRSYDQQIKAPGDVFMSGGVGDLAWLTDSGILGGTVDNDADFYASAYETSTEIVISFRGAEHPFGADADDLLALNTPTIPEQALLAVQFYNLIEGLNQSSYSGSKNIVVTGHSLGGALAGIVASLFHLDGYAVDNVPYEQVVDLIHTESASSWSDLYGIVPPSTPSLGDFDWVAVEGEIAGADRAFMGESYTPDELDLNDDDPLLGNVRHSTALVPLLMFLNDTASDSGWKDAENSVLVALTSDANADAIGLTQINGNPTSLWLQDAIAYTTMGGTVKPFGDTAGQVLVDDMQDLGHAIGDGLGIGQADALAAPLVSFAGSVAMAATVGGSTSGFLTYDELAGTLTADFSDVTWDFDYVESGVLAARENMFEAQADQAGASAFADMIKLNTDATYLDRIVFAVGTEGFDGLVPEPVPVDEEWSVLEVAFVGTGKSDIIQGSEGFDVIFGGTADTGVLTGDEITDDTGGAYIVGSNKADTIDNAWGSSWGGGGNDTITGNADAFGGDGDDTITAEDGGFAFGGAGDDILSGFRFFCGGDGEDEFHITNATGVANILFVSDPNIQEHYVELQDGSYSTALQEAVGLVDDPFFMIINPDINDHLYIGEDLIQGASYGAGGTSLAWMGSETERATLQHYGYYDGDLTYTAGDNNTASYIEVADGSTTIARIFGYGQSISGGLAGVVLAGTGVSYTWSYPGGAPPDADPTSGDSGVDAIDEAVLYGQMIDFTFGDHMWV